MEREFSIDRLARTDNFPGEEYYESPVLSLTYVRYFKRESFYTLKKYLKYHSSGKGVLPPGLHVLFITLDEVFMSKGLYWSIPITGYSSRPRII